MNLSRGVLLALVAVLLLLTVAFVLPFLQYFLLAVLLAYVLLPVQRTLETRVSDRIAASLTVLGATVVLLLPFLVVIRSTAAEATALVRRVQRGDLTFAVFENYIREFTGVEIEIGRLAQSALSGIGAGELSNLVGVLGTITHMVVGFGLALFLLYYFLKDREPFFRWLRHTVPLSDGVQDELYTEIDDIMRGVLAGHVLIAIFQGVIAGLGLVAVGIPSALFWTVVMVVLALLPIVGSFLVWGPAVVYLLATSRPLAAAFLLVYGTIVVGVSDDYLRPIVVDRYARINPTVVILGVFGGLYAIGVMGLFFGPVILGSLRATLDVFAREYGPGE
ncbi:AI-2E family transporter [Halobacterium zhouii]|uniref:AI-2E family transporter n=1 Tax=Halobacterium zhouii TaxID=2902624 RepID=UPI001E39217D|nr:AI-2E family transporter [Halobacterium zhouii]